MQPRKRPTLRALGKEFAQATKRAYQRALRLPKVADFQVKSNKEGRHGIYGYTKAVRFPSRFGGFFRKGEKVLELHVDTIRELSELKDKITELKNEGYVGMYGDTQDPKIRRIFENHFMAKIIKSPTGSKELAQIKYRANIKTRGYPAKHGREIPKRVIVRFA